MVKKKVVKPHMEESENDSSRNLEIQKILIQNSINLQKVVADLSVKFEKLSTQIAELLKLFEKSAKEFAEKQGLSEKDKEFLSKIDKLMEQNKTIAQGLTLMERRIKEKPFEEEEKEREIPIPKPLPEI